MTLQSTLDQVYKENNKVIKEHEYKNILKDIKNLGTSLEEIENVMMKEICSRSGTLNSQVDFKRSILSPKTEGENVQPHVPNPNPIDIQDLQKENIEVQENTFDSQSEILKELDKQKEETLDTIEHAKAEIYDNLDEILQNHVNALEEKKLLLIKDEKTKETKNPPQSLHDLTEDLKTRLTCIEDQLSIKVDQNLLEEKFTTIIETIAQLEAEIPNKSHITDIISELNNKSNISDVNKAFEDVYKILEERFVESPLQVKEKTK